MRRAILLLSLVACTGEPTTAHFDLPGATVDFYDLPFPNDLRRHPDSNTLDLSEFPTNSLIVDRFREAAEQLDGFGLNSGMFARFDGGLDPMSLPDPAASLTKSASVYVVDVDPDSPNRGERTPIAVTFRPTGNETIGINNLVVRPYPGFPLAEGTTYALVITTRVRGTNGESIEIAPGFAELAGTSGNDGLLTWARSQYQPLFDFLDEAGDDSRSDVATASVFTTQHATFVAPAIRAAVFNTVPPDAFDVMSPEPPKGGRFRTITGNYLAPNFQAGDPAYKVAPDGRIEVGSDGRAIITRMEPMRFMLTVPTMVPMPATGWPICIYAHGTGGSWTSFVGEGIADLLAKEGIAVISTDQVLHGPRNPGGDPELDFFNFGNVYAARDNALQGYADAWSQMRLALDAQLDAGGSIHTFDPTKVYFFGHSQGGATGPGFVAFEPTLTGAIFSGTAGALYENLLHKTEPLDIPGLVEQFARDNPMDENNPSLALVQMWMERSDPINYAPLMVRQPPVVDGVQIAPRAIFQTEGFTDNYSPNIGIEAFATALGADIVENRVQAGATKEILGVTLRGRGIVAAPITNNVSNTTAVLGQYNMRPGSDGHFVVFDIPSAQQHVAKFLGTLANTGQATVVQVQ